MKNYGALIVSFAVIAFLGLAFYWFSGNPIGLSELEKELEVNFDQVSSIRIIDGRGLNQPLIIRDDAFIEAITKRLSDLQIHISDEQEDQNGFVIHLDLMGSKIPTIAITFTKPLRINDVYYDVENQMPSISYFHELIKEYESSWQIE